MQRKDSVTCRSVLNATTKELPNVATAGTPAIRPEFIRPPRPGALCPFTGLSRGKLNQFVLPCVENGYCPPVKSVSLRKPGSLKGVRLIDYASLISYLRAFTNEGAAGNQVGCSARHNKRQSRTQGMQER